MGGSDVIASVDSHEALVAAINRHGVARWRRLLEPDPVRTLAVECRSAIDAIGPEQAGDWRLRYKRGPDGRLRVDRLDPASEFVPAVADIVDDPDLVAAASAVLATPGAAYKDRYIVKRPGTEGYVLHQDFAYHRHVDGDPACMVQALVALGPCTVGNGAIEVVPGAHRSLLTPAGVEVDPPPDTFADDAYVALELEVGDVAFTHILLPHRSPTNESDIDRPMLAAYFTARADDDARRRYHESYRTRSLGHPQRPELQ